MLICHFWISNIGDDENWLLVLKMVAGDVFFDLGFNRKLFMTQVKRKVYHPK
jgi:hypothetical protein